MTKYSLNMITNKEDIPVALFSDNINVETIEEIGQLIMMDDRSFIGYSIYDFETERKTNYVF